MRTLMMLIALLTLGLVGCATGNGATARGAGEPQYVNVRIVNDKAVFNQAGDPDEVLCKRVLPTGSRFKRTVCLTRAEWFAERHRAEQKIRLIRQRHAAAWQYQ